MKKYVRCTITRSNHQGEVYSNNSRPLGAGVNGRVIQIQEGEEVCLEKPFIYCFKDAVIEHTKVERDAATGKTKNIREEIPRFIINYKGFYMCDGACKGDYDKCKAQEITHDMFWEDDEDITAAIDKVEKTKKEEDAENSEDILL